MEALTATGRVVLGMIARGRRTGYDIKQLVDRSTRHFWAASYGQIYPELRRLEASGLIEGRAEPSGGRARTEYDLTAKGEQTLRDWLGSNDALIWELRDEGLLKLFLSDAMPEFRPEALAAMRGEYERHHQQLRLMADNKPAEMPLGAALTIELGLGMTRWLVDWCAAAEARLREEPTAPNRGAQREQHPG
jgi:PadR family transcriptional regulator AphA